MITATQAQPRRNPMIETREGTIISRLVFGKIFRFFGTMAPAGSVQGAVTFSPGLMGVRTSA